MAKFFESDSDTEELGFPNVVLPYQSYEPAPNQSSIKLNIQAAPMSLKMKKLA